MRPSYLHRAPIAMSHSVPDRAREWQYRECATDWASVLAAPAGRWRASATWQSRQRETKWQRQGIVVGASVFSLISQTQMQANGSETFCVSGRLVRLCLEEHTLVFSNRDNEVFAHAILDHRTGGGVALAVGVVEGHLDRAG